METDYITLTGEFLWVLTIICIISVFVHIIYFEKLPPLDDLQKEVKKSVDRADLIAESFSAIKDWNEKSLTPRMYAEIEEDSQRAMSLLTKFEKDVEEAKIPAPFTMVAKTKKEDEGKKYKCRFTGLTK